MNNNLSGRHISYFPFIDGMRALAVLSVVLFHLDPYLLPGGFIGVDVFFVISGFIVSASVSAFQGAKILDFFVIFYSRRIKRIFPALIFMLLLVFIVSSVFIPGSWLSWVNQSTGLYAFFGFSNFVLASTGRDYFAPTSDFNPFTHTWSLGVEEQFYLIFPFLYIFWLSSSKRYISSILYSLLGLASLIISFHLSVEQPTKAYYLTPGRFWELASGVLLYQFMTKTEFLSCNRNVVLRNIFAIASLIGLLSSFFVTTTDLFPMPGALLGTISTLGLFLSLYNGSVSNPINFILSNRYLVFIGKLSFSLYLWHWPVFVLFRWTCGLETPLQKGVALLITSVMTLISYFVVEKPIRSSRFLSRTNNWIVLFFGVFIICGSYLVAVKINGASTRLSQSVVTKSAQDWYPEGSNNLDGYPGCQAEPEHSNVNGGLLLTYKTTGCIRETKKNPHQIFVIGDSHALAYAGMFKSYAIKNNAIVYAYNNGGCPFLSFTPSRDLDVPICQQYSDSSLKDILNRVRAGDVLFLASLRLPRFVDQWAYFGDKEHDKILFSEQAQKGRERTINYAKSVLQPFIDKGVHIVFEAPKPLFKIPVYRCADWFNKNNPICQGGDSISRELIDKYRHPILSAYAELNRNIPLSVWDPLPSICNLKTCNAYKNGRPLFFDGDHLSGYGNKILLPSFSNFMNVLSSMTPEIVSLTGNEYKIDFSQLNYPSFVFNIEGLSQSETWGRWSDKAEGENVKISFVGNLPKKFALSINAIAFGPNVGKPVKVKYSGVEKNLFFSSEESVQTIDFSSELQSNVILIEPAFSVSPRSLKLGEDTRLLGVGLIELKVNNLD